MCFFHNVNQLFISYIQSDSRIILRNIHKICLIAIRLHTSSSAPPPLTNPFFFINFTFVFCKSLFFLLLFGHTGTINLHVQIR
jgi:hypothetical protein